MSSLTQVRVIVVAMEATNAHNEYYDSLRPGMANDVTFLFCIVLWLLEARNVSIFMCTHLFRSCVAEYGARYAQVVAVHTTYTLEIETIVNHDWSIILATSLCDALSRIFGGLRKKYRLSLKNDIPPRDKNYNHKMTHHKLMRDLCLALRISLSKKCSLVAELEALGEQEGVVKPLERIRDIVAHDVVTLREFETLLARA
nr:hypothetical protein [Tanacetum cinerariifolium]